MLRGCLGALALLAIVVGLYFWWLDQVFEMPGSLIAAGVVGFVVFCCIGALQNALRAYKDWSLFSTAGHDALPRGGRLMAVSGTIHPLEAPLVAPFSGEQCLICEYDLTSQHRPADSSTGKPNGVDYTGFLMSPSVIRSSFGEVRLVGYPLLEGFDEVRCTGYDSARNAIQFLTTSQFEDRTGLKMVTLFNVFGQVWCDDDGHVQKNIRIGKVKLDELFPEELQGEIDRFSEWEQANPDEARAARESIQAEVEEDDEDLDEADSADEEEVGGGHGVAATVPIMCEKRVRVGETVCAIGIYDEFKMGLCPPQGSSKANRLLKGTAEQIATRARKSLVSNVIGALVVLAIVNAGVFGAMQIYLNSKVVAKDRENQAFEAARKGDLAALQRLARRKFDLHAKDDGLTLLMVADDPAVTEWLIAQGVDVNAADKEGMTALMHAARHNRIETVKQLLAAKADIDAVSRSSRRTALREADESRSYEIAALLRQAGAKDDVVTIQNGQPLPGDGGPQLQAVKDYLAALQSQDVPRLKELIASDNDSTFDANPEIWELWQKTHVAEVTAFEGFERGGDTTLTVFGNTSEGSHVLWRYQLRREGDAWKIVREDWVYN